ncbi:MAG: hypothetical protein NC907_02080 [Candidatus Omnitrophica bacterium]|nr:hypothetical protein [Candidatus Omnitrophota bacterium]
MADIITLKGLSKDDVPERLRVEFYFDFNKYNFRHKDLLTGPEINSVIAVLDAIHSYAVSWIKDAISKKENEDNIKVLGPQEFQGKCIGDFTVYVEEGAIFEPSFIKGSLKEKKSIFVGKQTILTGSNIFLDEGDIYIGENNSIEPGTGIKGPTIIGDKNEIRQGTYLRGDVIIGDGGTYRGEIKNAVMMDKANFPHPSYVGDSICGYATTTGNLGTYAEGFGKKNVIIEVGEKKYDIGRPKIGIILGDWSQVGCNSVSDPGVFVGPKTIFYSLCRISKGFYGPNEVLKNKPLEHGIIERSPLRM